MTSPTSPQVQLPPVAHLTTHHPRAWGSTSTLAEAPASTSAGRWQPMPRPDPENVRGSSEMPPPYDVEHGLPTYAPVQSLSKAATTIRYLFLFGFIFPPLWIIGASTLLFSAKAPSESLPIVWLSGKNEAQETPDWNEREAIETERLWARRCTWALVIVVCAAITTVAAIFGERDISRKLSQT